MIRPWDYTPFFPQVPPPVRRVTLPSDSSMLMLSMRVFVLFVDPAMYHARYKLLPHIRRTFRGKRRRKAVATILRTWLAFLDAQVPSKIRQFNEEKLGKGEL